MSQSHAYSRAAGRNCRCQPASTRSVAHPSVVVASGTLLLLRREGTLVEMSPLPTLGLTVPRTGSREPARRFLSATSFLQRARPAGLALRTVLFSGAVLGAIGVCACLVLLVTRPGSRQDVDLDAIPNNRRGEVAHLQPAIGRVATTLKDLRVHILALQGPDEAAKLDEFRKALEMLEAKIDQCQCAPERQLPSRYADVWRAFQRTALYRDAIRHKRLPAERLDELLSLDQKFYEMQRRALTTFCRSSLTRIRDRALKLSTEDLIARAREAIANRSRSQVGYLTQLAGELGQLRGDLVNALRVDQEATSPAANPATIRRLLDEVDDLASRIRMYRTACFSRYCFEELDRIREELEQGSTTDREAIDCYLRLCFIELPADGIAYGVRRELEQLRQKLFDEKWKDRPDLRREAHKQLLDAILDERLSKRVTISVDDF